MSPQPKAEPKIDPQDITKSNKFKRSDIAISYGQHALNLKNGVYPSYKLVEGVKNLSFDLNGIMLEIRREDTPTFEDLKVLLTKVGKGYGWDRRREYHDPKEIAELSRHLADESTARRYSFWANGVEVGGVIIANVEKARMKKNESRLAYIFGEAHDESPDLGFDSETAEKAVEIYKIGLFPEWTKHGWGSYFVSMVLTELFNEDVAGQRKYNAVYLNTRDTNHSKVVDFYERLNMHVIHTMTYPDDLLTDKEIEEYARQRKELDEFAARNGFVANCNILEGLAPA